jgi:hypothetical protein
MGREDGISSASSANLLSTSAKPALEPVGKVVTDHSSAAGSGYQGLRAVALSAAMCESALWRTDATCVCSRRH